MKGLDWSNESYVRLYRADTPAWRRLHWEAQGVYMLVLRQLDRAGTMPVDGLLPFEAVAEMTGAPEDVVERALEKIVTAGFLEVNKAEDLLVDPEFLEREETAKSDAQRQRESRNHRRDRAKSSHSVTDQSRNVTNPSQLVTDSHGASRSVTPIPSPSLIPSRTLPAEKTKRAASPSVSFKMPSEWQNLGISSPEARALSLLIENPKKVDVNGVKASHVTDEKSMRLERLHHLAELIAVSNITETDTSLQLWCAWRVKARVKARPRLASTSTKDWRNEVETLRKLRERILQRRAALTLGELNGWRGFEWEWVRGIERKSFWSEA